MLLIVLGMVVSLILTNVFSINFLYIFIVVLISSNMFKFKDELIIVLVPLLLYALNFNLKYIYILFSIVVIYTLGFILKKSLNNFVFDFTFIVLYLMSIILVLVGLNLIPSDSSYIKVQFLNAVVYSLLYFIINKIYVKKGEKDVSNY